jgi:3-methyl-2-oxobutanoate hydroxymethyltransferase
MPEYVPTILAETVTNAIDVPTIGFGAGPNCDGQVLVIDEVLGLAE